MLGRKWLDQSELQQSLEIPMQHSRSVYLQRIGLLSVELVVVLTAKQSTSRCWLEMVAAQIRGSL